MRRVTLCLTIILSAWTGTASAVTVDQIVSLSKAGISEAVILALIERDRTILSIDPDQIVTLKREGLSDTLITAMLQSGRQEGEDAARAVSSWNAATILSGIASTPDVVIVGHGPDRPNTVHTEDWYSGFRDGVVLPYSYRVGSNYALPSYSLPRFGYRSGLTGNSFRIPQVNSFGSAQKGRTGDRMLCVAQVNTASGPGPSYVTECPGIMQRQVRSAR